RPSSPSPAPASQPPAAGRRPSKSRASPRRRSFTSPARRGSTAWPSTFSAASWRRRRASGLPSSWMSDCSSRSRWWTRVFGCRRRRCRAWRSRCRVDPASGQKISVLDVSAEPMNDSGGAGALSTATDYLRFAQMLLNGGELDGVRVLSRSTIKLMTSDHLGTRIAAPFPPGELLLGTPGYTFGLGFAVRQGDGVAGVAGSAGEFMWAGYAGTYFWVDPKEEI